MAHCTQPNCNWKGTQKGLLIHLGRVHKVRKDYDSESNVLASESKQGIGVYVEDRAGKVISCQVATPCPVPGCKVFTTNLPSHLQQFHDDWRLSSGKWVFEV